MRCKLLFDLLLLAVLVLILLGAASAVARPGLLPAQIADYQGTFTPEQYEGRHWLRVALIVPSALLAILATVCVLRKRRVGPAVYCASVITTMIVVEFLRPYVHPGSGEDNYELAIVLMAPILFLLFFTPVKKWYLPS